MYVYTRVIVASEKLKDSDHFQSFVFQVNKLLNSFFFLYFNSIARLHTQQ